MATPDHTPHGRGYQQSLVYPLLQIYTPQDSPIYTLFVEPLYDIDICVAIQPLYDIDMGGAGTITMSMMPGRQSPGLRNHAVAQKS